jgi:hypothetical protein
MEEICIFWYVSVVGISRVGLGREELSIGAPIAYYPRALIHVSCVAIALYSFLLGTAYVYVTRERCVLPGSPTRTVPGVPVISFSIKYERESNIYQLRPSLARCC